MSWDVVLFNSTESINSIDTLDPKALKPADFCKKLKAYFPAVEEEDDFRVITIGNSAIEYKYNPLPSNNILLSLDSEPALFALIKFAKKHNYQIHDTSLDSMLNLDKPHVNGYKDYLADVKADMLKNRN